MTIKNNLKWHRTNKGLTMEKLADICGTSRAYICKMENKNSIPGLSIAYAISNALGVTVYAIWEDPDNKNQTEQDLRMQITDMKASIRTCFNTSRSILEQYDDK